MRSTHRGGHRRRRTILSVQWYYLYRAVDSAGQTIDFLLSAREACGAVAARGRFILAVSGGHTPWQMLTALTREELPWDSTIVYAAHPASKAVSSDAHQ